MLSAMGITRLLKFIDSPVSWVIAGFAIGLALGVVQTSAWLVTAGLAAFIVYLMVHGPAQQETEGRLFSASGLFLTAWLVGFVVHGLAF